MERGGTKRIEFNCIITVYITVHVHVTTMSYRACACHDLRTMSYICFFCFDYLCNLSPLDFFCFLISYSWWYYSFRFCSLVAPAKLQCRRYNYLQL